MHKLQSHPVPRMLRTREAAAYLGISEWSLRRLVKLGKIRVKFGNGVRSPWLFDIRELDRYIEENQLPKRHR